MAYMPPRAQVRGEFRKGRIDSVDKDNHRAKVKFEEQDGFTSWDLQVLVPVGGDYAMPAQDTPVLCLLLEGRLGTGFVLGAFYTENDSPPLSDAGKRSLVGDDLRLGAADASDKVALAPKVKDELDKIRDELTKIKTTLASITGGITTTATFGTPYTGSYSPSDVAAENVSAK